MYELIPVVIAYVLYVVIDLFTTMAILRTIAPQTHSFLTGGNEHSNTVDTMVEDPQWIKYIAIAVLDLVFCPVILVYLLTVNRMTIEIKNSNEGGD